MAFPSPQRVWTCPICSEGSWLAFGLVCCRVSVTIAAGRVLKHLRANATHLGGVAGLVWRGEGWGSWYLALAAGCAPSDCDHRVLVTFDFIMGDNTCSEKENLELRKGSRGRARTRSAHSQWKYIGHQHKMGTKTGVTTEIFLADRQRRPLVFVLGTATVRRRQHLKRRLAVVSTNPPHKKEASHADFFSTVESISESVHLPIFRFERDGRRRSRPWSMVDEACLTC